MRLAAVLVMKNAAMQGTSFTGSWSMIKWKPVIKTASLRKKLVMANLRGRGEWTRALTVSQSPRK
jgi:hypothetical protein